MKDAGGAGAQMSPAPKEVFMERKSLLMAALVGCAALVAEPAAARFVVANGERLASGNIRYLDQLSCSHIADGRYWLNTRTGIWGYEGGGPQGHISDNCKSRRRSLSERGLLYSPGELLR